MRITTNGTTISGSLSEVLATLTHITQLGANAPVTTNPVTMPLVTEIAVTDPEDMEKVAESIVAAMRTRGLLTQADDAVATPVPVPKLTRDSVIKMAISDVEDLLSRDYYRLDSKEDAVVKHVGDVVDFVIGGSSDRVDFFINADKRTVIAKLYLETTTYVTAKEKAYATQGRAKCAPGDVFNEHIGKAIALRRALGLEVPVEYFTVEARDRDDLAVGDVVRGDQEGFYDYVTHITELIENPDVDEANGQAFTHTKEKGWLASSQVTLINDSARHTAPDLEVSRIIRH